MRAVAWVLVFLTGCVSGHPGGIGRKKHGAPVDASASGDASAPLPPWQTIGASVDGRPLRVMRLGSGPRRALWVGGIHGDEREGAIATAELPAAFLRTPGAAEKVTLTILEDANPDGSAQNTRGNRNGVDLNRNYPAKNYLPGDSRGERPLDQPEAKALHDLVLEVKPDVMIVAHAWRGDTFINFDGPAAKLAERFGKASGLRVKPSDRIAPTPGSLGSWVGHTLGWPILTLEYLRGSDPRANWEKTKPAILAVIVGD
jgi:protein MpaA